MKTQHVEFYTESESEFFQNACELLGIEYVRELSESDALQNEKFSFAVSEEQEKLIFNLLKYNYIHNILN